MSLYIPTRRPKKKRMSEINVVPYIDVMLVLLVIFMVTTPLLTQGVKVALPQAQATPIKSEAQEPLIVSVDKRGRYFLNVGDNAHKPLSNRVLVTRVKAVMRHRRDNTVYVKGDRQVAYGRVVSVMAALKRAGVEQVGLVTRMPEKPKR